MIYCINLILIVIVFFLIAKMYNVKEGIDELKKPKDGIPNVPSDSLCMVLGLMELGVDEYGTLAKKCAFDEKDETQPDTSNTCN